MDGSHGFRARKNFSIALFLVVSGRLVSGPVFFRRYPEFRFLPFCPEFFLMGRVWQKLPPKNFAVMRFLVFCPFGVRAAVVLRYLLVRFLSWFWLCSLLVLYVRFVSVSRAFPLRLSSSLFFSLLRVFLLWGVGRGGGFLPCSASPLSC